MTADRHRRRLVLRACALGGAVLAGRIAGEAFAQAYPARAVKVILPYSPGSNPGIATHIVAPALAEKLGQRFVIDARLGAGGAIGLAAGAKSAPDGYTVVTGHVGALAINPSVYDKLPYDVPRDFAPITQLYQSPLLLLVAESSPYKTLDDLLADARARPGAVTYASGGNGTGAHLSGEALGALSGASMRHIPFKSVSDALVGVAGGDITFSFGNISLGLPLVQGKKLRALALSGDARMAEVPGVPTVGETIRGFEFHDWSGMLAPAGTPRDIVARLQQEISAVTAQPEVIRQMRAQGLIPVQNSAEEFARFIEREEKKWGALARGINLKLT